MLTEFHIGIDDTDSKLGGCTTYTATLILEELLTRKLGLSDFPWLVRLNPNIPWKTRGNGALAIHLRTDTSRLEEIEQLALGVVEKTSDPSIPSTDPAVVFLQGTIPHELESFTTQALHDVIRLEEAERLVKRVGADAHTFSGRRGIIGALAAIGYSSNRDHTYEIIAYRTRENLGKPRRVDLDSVRKMDLHRQGQTFNNVDPETGRVLICPHGPDPVLLGIRGEDPESLLMALREIQVQEPIDRVMLFKTNHGTDAHLTYETNIDKVSPHQSVVVAGTIETHPVILKGGHVIFKLYDETGSIDCAAYEPTGSLRRTVLELISGDRVRALGGVRRRPLGQLSLNLEKLEVLELIDHVNMVRPRCTECGSSCESMGKNQGLRCRKCGLRFSRDSIRAVVINRPLKKGMYFPPPRAHRHLTKPASRYARPSTGLPWSEEHGSHDWESLLSSTTRRLRA